MTNEHRREFKLLELFKIRVLLLLNQISINGYNLILVVQTIYS